MDIVTTSVSVFIRPCEADLGTPVDSVSDPCILPVAQGDGLPERPFRADIRGEGERQTILEEEKP